MADLSRPSGDVVLTVFEPEDGLRIDRFLKGRLAWRSRAQSALLIRDGRVFLNGEPVTKSSKKVSERDEVRIEVPEDETFGDPAEIPLEVVYEDAHLLAVNKQPGLVCHPVGSVRHGTLINALHARHRDPDHPDRDVIPRLCHRLDRDTSGVLLVALSERVRRQMQYIFESKVVVKEYLAIARGLWERDYDEVHLPLGPAGPDAEVRISMAVDEANGAPSRTVINVVDRYPPADDDEGYTLLRCSPVTGRQHQIRVHLAARGHPILGDPIYGGAPVRGFRFPAEGEALLRRQALHAYRIQLPHPVIEELDLDLYAPPPQDFEAAVRWLQTRKAKEPE